MHLLKPDYDTPYGDPNVEEIKKLLDKVRAYLEETTPPAVIDKVTGKEINDLSKIDKTILI